MPTSTDQPSASIQLKQLIPPKIQATRGKSFHLSGNEECLLYPHGKSVYLYNTLNHTASREYREHAYNVGVAKLSPSGTFIASGDQSGILRVWSFATLKTELEVKALGGMIADLTWSEDEKLIALCGEGREQFANVVKVDGGASFGELVGPSKTCTSIALSSDLCLLASDDKSLTIYKPSPKFKFIKSLKDHEGFVQVVRLNHGKGVFATAGADGKVIIYSSFTFEKLCEIKAHESGVLAMEWIDDFTLVTASTDKSLKILKLASDYKTAEIQCQSEVNSNWTHDKQICGIKVHGGNVTVLRLDGSLKQRSLKDLMEVECFVYAGLGHAKGIVDIIQDANGFTTVSYDGLIKSWTQKFDSTVCVNERGIMSNVNRLKSENEIIFEKKLVSKDSVVELESKVVGVEFEGDLIILESGKVIRDKGECLDLGISSVRMTASNDDKLVVLSADLKIYSKDLELIITNNNNNFGSNITAMALNQDGSKLAVADDQRRIKLYTLTREASLIKEESQWCAHSARIDTLCWISADRLVSSGVDGNIMMWSLQQDKYAPVQVIKSAHSGPINKIMSINDSDIVSIASDSCIKLWTTHNMNTL